MGQWIRVWRVQARRYGPRMQRTPGYSEEGGASGGQESGPCLCGCRKRRWLPFWRKGSRAQPGLARTTTKTRKDKTFGKFCFTSHLLPLAATLLRKAEPHWFCFVTAGSMQTDAGPANVSTWVKRDARRASVTSASAAVNVSYAIRARVWSTELDCVVLMFCFMISRRGEVSWGLTESVMLRGVLKVVRTTPKASASVQDTSKLWGALSKTLT